MVEAYGPFKSAFIIEGITDNKNRTIGAIRIVLDEHHSKMADPGSVLWAFTNQGGEWHANFPQEVSDEARESIAALIEALEDLDDIQKVTTNTT